MYTSIKRNLDEKKDALKAALIDSRRTGSTDNRRGSTDNRSDDSEEHHCHKLSEEELYLIKHARGKSLKKLTRDAMRCHDH